MDLIGTMYGVIGIALAAIFSSFGYLYRGRIESKRSARKVLYLLLEIRYALTISLYDSHSATKDYISHFTKRLKEKEFDIDEAQVYTQIGSIVQNYFSNVAKTLKIDIVQSLVEPFENALSRLAEESPVLAYQLRGKEKIELLAQVNASYLDSEVLDTISMVDNELLQSLIKDFSTTVSKDSIQKIFQNLDEEIILLAKHCGWAEYFKCRKILLTRTGGIDNQVIEELDKMLDVFIEKIINLARNTNSQTENS